MGQNWTVLKDHTVLIVEDDESVREALVDALGGEGYAAVAAENGQQALDLLQQGLLPCLVILDLMMPVMNGWTFLSSIRADRRFADLRVCIVSAVPTAKLPAEAICALPKPVDLSALLGVVDTYC